MSKQVEQVKVRQIKASVFVCGACGVEACALPDEYGPVHPLQGWTVLVDLAELIPYGDHHGGGASELEHACPSCSRRVLAAMRTPLRGND